MKKTTAALIISLTLCSCADMGFDKNGKPRATFVGARATKFVATEQGFYAEGLDAREGFKDFMDFGGLVTSSYFGADVMKALSADSIAVDQASVKAGTEQLKATEKTKQIGIKEATKVKGMELEAAHAVTQ